MSLVTLSSKRNTLVQRDTDPAIIKNHFKDGLVLREGTEVGLVSLTINKLDLFEVIAGQNDVFIWRIGNRQSFEQHTVTINEGNYNGSTLAIELASKANASTLLGNYKGQWTCVFDQTGQGGQGSFTMNYGQNDVPAAPNEQTYSVFDGGTPNFTNNGSPSVNISGSTGGQVDDFSSSDNPLIITGNKGIFPNDGDFECIIRPQEGYTEADQITALQAGGSPVDQTIYIAGVPNLFEGTFNNTTGTPAANGWQLAFQYTNGDPPAYWVYLGDGEWGHALTGINTANRTNCDDFYFWNPTRGVFADADNGGRHTENPLVGDFFIITGGTQFTVPQGNVGMGKSVSGYVRNYLYKGRTNYPGDVNADILKTSPDGFDITLTCEDNDDKTGVEFSLGRMVQNAGIEFPNANWRLPSALIADFQNLDPTADFTSLPVISGVQPANWTSYTYPTDHIKMRVAISKVLQVQIYLSHDTAGDNVFIEEQFVRRTGDANGFNTTIKEKFFPLRPCMAIGRGNQYFSSRYIVKGKYDTTEIVNPNFQVASEAITLHKGDAVDLEDESETVSTSPLGAVPTNAMTVSALYKFGEIYASDTTGNPPEGGLDAADLTPVGSINTLLGFNRLYNFVAGQTSNGVTSTNNPITNIAEPTLSLELPDFNIKGANGNTGDSMRVIAVVPKEELNTNEKTGTLHYYPAFPIMIDLNLPQEQIFYDLNAILRLPDGKVANDLINPTEITLLFKEGEESKQRRMMKEQAQLISSMMGNKQSAMIGGIGSGNPLI